MTMSIISTFEGQCRALSSAPGPDDNTSRFLVGTQILRGDNTLYLYEYKDDHNSLAKVSFKFPYGESWHINTSSKYPRLMTNVVGRNGLKSIALYKLPDELDRPLENEDRQSESQIERLFDLVGEEKNLTPQCHWHPDDGSQLLVANDGFIQFWDIESQTKASEFSITRALDRSGALPSGQKAPKVTDLRWSSLFDCSVVAVAMNNKIYGIDTRISDSSPSSIGWVINDKRCNRINSIDFNPNSQYYLASGGDDCRANFWDLRDTTKPAMHLLSHTHWIWSIRYNPFHDQLVLTAGSDARVSLMRVKSLASEPFGQMVGLDDEVLEDDKILGDEKSTDERQEKEAQDNSLENLPPKAVEDDIVNIYEEHDDSVYVAEWATDPWIFASLGYESRLVINKVPKSEKFSIIF